MYEIVGPPLLTGAADATVPNATVPIRQVADSRLVVATRRRALPPSLRIRLRDQKARTNPALHRRYLPTTLLFSLKRSAGKITIPDAG
jgi:hypothetical protein